MKYDLTCIDCINVVINLKSKTECQLGIGCMETEREKKGRGEERRVVRSISNQCEKIIKRSSSFEYVKNWLQDLLKVLLKRKMMWRTGGDRREWNGNTSSYGRKSSNCLSVYLFNITACYVILVLTASFYSVWYAGVLSCWSCSFSFFPPVIARI